MGTQYAYRGEVDLAAFVRDVPGFSSVGIAFNDSGSRLGDRSVVWLVEGRG